MMSSEDVLNDEPTAELPCLDWTLDVIGMTTAILEVEGPCKRSSMSASCSMMLEDCRGFLRPMRCDCHEQRGTNEDIPGWSPFEVSRLADSGSPPAPSQTVVETK
jgi:hypothetical protein